ncbi:transposase domain-containing protein, partial [Salininema proteolyticum]
MFPQAMVEEAVDECGVREERDRTLPAALTTYLGLGLWLWPGQGAVKVLRNMTDALTWAALDTGAESPAVVNSSSITKARKRLGYEVYESLFAQTIAARDTFEDERWHGLTAVGVDGMCVDVPDTEANREAFGSHPEAAFPQMQIVAACEIASRLLTGAAIGAYATGEKTLTVDLAAQLVFQEGHVYVFDRGFCGYDLFGRLRATGAHVVMRAGSQFPLTQAKVLPDGTYLAELHKAGREAIT